MTLHRPILAALLLASFAQASATNLISNGGFEAGAPTTPNLVAFGAQQLFGGDTTGLAGWTVIGSDIAFLANGNAYHLATPSGNNFLDLTGWHSGGMGAGVTQTIATVAGTSYTLSFDIGNSSDYNYGTNDSLMVSVGNLSTLFATTQSAIVNSWDHVSFNFVAQGSSTNIAFAGQDAIWYIGLDNVDVSATGSAVPEPSGLSLLGAGLLGMLGWRRRRTPSR